MRAWVLRIAAILWFVVIAARYVSTVQKSLLDPFRPGADVEWALIAVITAVVLGISLFLFRKTAIKLWAALILVAAILFIVLSSQIASAILALWVLGAATLLGDLCLSKLGVSLTESLFERFVVAFPIGIIGVGTLALGMALLGLYTRPAAWVVLCVLTVIQLPRLTWLVPAYKQRVRKTALMDSMETAFLVLLLGLSFVRNLLWSVAPEVEFDSLNMRLSVPHLFIEQGRLFDLPYFWHSYFVHLLEYFHGFCIALHGDAVAKFAVAVIALVAAATVYVLGRMVFSPLAGLWAAVFFYTTPLVSWGAATTYNDNAIAEFLAAALVSFVFWYRSRHRGWIVASGVLAGGAVAVKLNAAFAVLPLGIVLLFVLITDRISVGGALRSLIAFTAPCLMIVLPWYLIVYVWTGNPVFPLLNGVFRSPFWEIDNTLMDSANFGVGLTPGALLRLPFRLTLDTTRFASAVPRGGLGPLLLLFIPFGFAKMRRHRERLYLAVVCCVYLGLWTASFQYGRYYTAILPVVAILGLGGFLASAPHVLQSSRRFVLAILLVAQVAQLPILYWRIPERFPVRLALGLESQESLLRRGLIGYNAVEYLNTVTLPGERVLTIGLEDLRLYLNAPLETLSEARLDSHLQREVELRSGDLAEAMSGAGIAYLLFRREDLVNPPQYYPYADAGFLQEFAMLEYSDSDVQVYRLRSSK